MIGQEFTTRILRLGTHLAVEPGANGVPTVVSQRVVLVAGRPQPLVLAATPENAMYQEGDNLVIQTEADPNDPGNPLWSILRNHSLERTRVGLRD